MNESVRPRSTLLAQEGSGSFLQESAYIFFLIFLLFLFVVIIEPSPSDLAFVMAFSAIAMSGKFYLPASLRLPATLLLVYALTNFASGIAWKNGEFGAKYIGVTIYMLMIPLVMANFSYLKGEAGIDRMYKYFFASAAISAVVGAMAVLHITPGPITLYYREDEGLRLSPLFKDPNVYGPYMGLASLLALAYSVKRDTSKRYIWIGFSLFFLLMMFLTFSRGAWGGISVSFFSFIVLAVSIIKERSTLIRVGRIMLLSGMSIVLGGGYLLQKLNLIEFLLLRFRLQSYDSHRFSNWSNALDIISNRPFGVGPGHYVGRNNFPDSDFGLATHNLYLKVAVENGWLGFASFFSFVAVLGYISVSTLRSPDHRLPIRIALVSALVGQLVSSIVVDSLHWRHLFVLFGFLMCEIYLSKVKQNDPQTALT